MEFIVFLFFALGLQCIFIPFATLVDHPHAVYFVVAGIILVSYGIAMIYNAIVFVGKKGKK